MSAKCQLYKNHYTNERIFYMCIYCDQGLTKFDMGCYNQKRSAQERSASEVPKQKERHLNARRKAPIEKKS
jgi:hypothetical protein